MRCLVLCFVCFVAGVWAQADDFESCNTPEGQPGECISIRRCPSLLNLIQKQPYSPDIEDYLRRARCGFEGLDSKVCCLLENGGSTAGGGGGTGTKNPSPPSGGGKKPAISSSLLPSTDVCGPTVAERIVGGQVTDLMEFPWMALIEYQKPNGRGFYCGGALINNRYVITAAHCVKGKDLPSNWKLTSVRLGEHDTSLDQDCDNTPGYEYCADPPVNVPVKERIAHEDYDPFSTSQHHDIALLRLAREVQFTDFVKPVCLPTTEETLNNQYSGVNATVAGWGKTETRSESNVKLKLDLTVKSNSDCASVYGSRVTFGPGQMCAGGQKGKDSCRGDSGGPLMVLEQSRGLANYYLTGVVSFGPNPCGLEGWPGVYTRVTEYMPWIVSKLKP